MAAPRTADRELLALAKKPNLTPSDVARIRRIVAARARARIAEREQNR